MLRNAFWYSYYKIKMVENMEFTASNNQSKDYNSLTDHDEAFNSNKIEEIPN